MLSAASVVVPVAAVALGSGPVGAVIPLGGAAAAYVLCVRACGAALFPRGVSDGLLGSELLETVKASGADLRQMQDAAANYLDEGYRGNDLILKAAAERVGHAISLLMVEILALALALVITLVS